MTSYLPPCAPFPPASVVSQLPAAEWTSCIEAWEFLLQAYLAVPLSDLTDAAKQYQSLVAFLLAYAGAAANPHGNANLTQAGQNTRLRRLVFLSAHRLLVEQRRPPDTLLDWRFLSQLSRLYRGAASLQDLLQRTWAQHAAGVEGQLRPYKEALIKSLEARTSTVVLQPEFASQLLPLAHALPPVAGFFLAGADLVDSVVSAYPDLSEEAQRRVSLLVYLGMASLLQGPKPNASMLFDLMYTLKTGTPTTAPPRGQSFLADMVTDTPLLSVMKKTLLAPPYAARAGPLLASLEPLQRHDPRPRKSAKGKAKAAEAPSVHNLSLITQIQDLFPDLGTAFIASLLSHYANSVEAATAALLDNALPPSLASLDRSASLSLPVHNKPAPVLTTSLPVRANKYDNDAFDRLAIPHSQLRTGKAKSSTTADTLLAAPGDRTHAKAAILSALAAIDLDDDERDDTYDAEDVGGTVDAAGDMDAHEDAHEETLFRAWSADAGVFGREQRRSKGREALKAATGLADEVLEGWATMLARDARKVRRLENRYSLAAIAQEEVARTSWREGVEDEQGARGRGRGGFRGRGRGRGASVAGASDDKATQAARQRKEANKGSRANHNRREGRAKKMARGGFAG